MIPKASMIIGYKEIFGKQAPEDRLSIVKGLSRKHLVIELAGINYRLKPKNIIAYDISLKTQKDILEYVSPDNETYNFCAFNAEKYSGRDKYPLFFIRSTLLFAIEELLNSDLEDIDEYKLDRNFWLKLIEYILAVNSYGLNVIKEPDVEREQDVEKQSLEDINFKTLPLNELMIEADPLNKLYRGYQLSKYLENSDIGEEFKKYIYDNYQCEPDFVIYEILSMSALNKQKDSKLDFYYSLRKEKIPKLFIEFSKRLKNDKVENLINVKKSPMFKWSDTEYLCLDINLLIEKSYYLLINDFWFDYLKKKGYSIKKYRSIIGYFFEDYIRDKFTNGIKKYKCINLKLFDELKYESGKGVKEFADIFLRDRNKVLLGQVKSSSIYDNERFDTLLEGESVEYEKIYKKFGLDQLIESIKNFETEAYRFDKQVKTGKIDIFPVLIVNEKALQTPIMAMCFNDKFKELLGDNKNSRLSIKDLVLIHVSDVERLEVLYKVKKKKIWEILEKNNSNEFTTPFYKDVNEALGNVVYDKSIEELFKRLIIKYSDKYNKKRE